MIEDEFSNVVDTLKWGRMALANIRRLLQFNATYHFSVLLASLLGFLFFGEGLFTPFQLAWVALSLDILAPIALLTEPPSDVILLERPYERKELLMTGPNNYGMAVVRMKVGPKYEFVFIDDYVLCHDKRPLFSQPIKSIYMWPCLLEKAWLKAKGNTGKRIEKA